MVQIVKHKCFLFGLDNAGKTSIVNYINNLPDPGDTLPTLSFNINQIIIKDTEFIIWDAPGQVRYREKWKIGMLEAAILCYVVDMSIPIRFNEAKMELDKVLALDEAEGLPLIICFHKLDYPDSQKALPKAKGMFSKDLFSGRDVYTLETTIFNPDSILKLKDLLVEIIEKARW